MWWQRTVAAVAVLAGSVMFTACTGSAQECARAHIAHVSVKGCPK